MIRIKAAITTACTVALVGVGALTGPLVAHSDDTVLGPDAGPDALAARIVAGMTNTSLVVMPDGRICGWGNPFTEQFGEWVNGVYSASTPTCFTLPGEVPATAISADMHAVALGADGVAYTWGGSIEGAVAYEVDDQPAYLPRPVAMPVTTRVTAVSAGFSHTAVLTEDGDIYMSGSNSYGQLGDGSESPSARGETSVKVTADDVAFTAISAGNKHTLAVSGEGRVYAWGWDGAGQLGPNGSFDLDAVMDNPYVGRGGWIKRTPVEVEELPTIVAVAAGYDHSVALSEDGHVSTWGSNQGGQLGDDTAGGYSTTPVPVDISGVVGIAAGWEVTMAWTAEGRLYAWGDNASGGLGTGTLNDASTPQEVPGITAVAVSTSGNHTLAIGRDGQIYTWGENNVGALGGDEHRFTAVPERVADLPPIAWVAAGENMTLAVTDRGDVFTWGWNGSFNGGEKPDGRLGTGDIPRRSLPEVVNGISDVVEADVYSSHVVALTADGQVWTWGSNDSGELGRAPDVLDRPSPTPGRVITLPPEAGDVANVGAGANVTLVRTTEGDVWGWGWNFRNQFGLSSGADPALNPTRADIELMGAASALSVGSSSALVVVEGTVSGFGANFSGELGDRPGDTPDRKAVAIKGLEDTTIIQADAGSDFTMAVDSAGQVWTLGSNTQWQLGRGDPSSSWNDPTPGMVTGLPAVSAVSAGGTLAMALSRDGSSVYTWGTWGLGSEPAAGVATPVEVAGLPDTITQIAAGYDHAVALSADGDVYTWGDNFYGELGVVSSLWVPRARVPDLRLWDPPEPSGPDTGATDDTGSTGSPEPSDSETPTPSNSGSPSPGEPSSPPPSETSGPAPSDSGSPSPGGPGSPPSSGPTTGDTSGGEPTGHPGEEDPARNSGDLPGGAPGGTGAGASPGPRASDADSLHATGAHQTDASAGLGAGAGAGATDLGTSSIGGAPARPGTSPRIARFGTRFKTVVVPAGTTAKLKVVAYKTPGTTAGTARVTWWASTPAIASPVKGAKTGSLSWRAGTTATLSVTAFTVGRTRVALASMGTRTATIQIKVVPPAKAEIKRLRAVKLTGASTLATGRSTVLKPELTPAGAIRTAGTWRSSDPSVATVNPIGRVTAKAAGRAVIVLKVHGKTAKKTITVR